MPQPDRDDRPPIEYEKTLHTLVDDLALQVSKAKTPVPRFTIELGRLRDGRISRYIPLDKVDALIAALQKFAAEHVPHMLAEVETARAEADARRNRRRGNGGTGGGGGDYGRPRRDKRDRGPMRDVDLSAAERRSAKARERNAATAARLMGEGQ